MTSFKTHDNGGRAFWVTIENLQVWIFRCVYDPESKDFWKGPLLHYFNAEHVYIGKSPKNTITLFSGGYGTNFDGNSILLKMSKNKFVFIGESVFQFHLFPNDKELRFYSPIGNNDVPYPYIVGKNYIYALGLSHKAIKRSDFPAFTKRNELEIMTIFPDFKKLRLDLPKYKILTPRFI